jgi:hypothetical protein
MDPAALLAAFVVVAGVVVFGAILWRWRRDG